MIVKWINKEIEVLSEEPLLDILRQHDVYFPLYCGGGGYCGKCLIQVKDGWLPVTGADRQYLTEGQIKAGYRLGCQAVITESCVLEPIKAMDEQDFFVPSSIEVREEDAMTRLGIAVDIGTTTIAMVLVNLDDGNICGQYTGLNHQRSYGTDVMLRIQAASAGKGSELQKMIRRDLAKGFRNLIEGTDGIIESIAVAGNTTMLHVLRGYDCSGLGGYPFHSVSLDFEKISADELLGSSFLNFETEKLEHTEVILLPGISAFIGADITAGLLGCGIWQSEKPRLFLDLGTNAEMVVGCREKLLAASAAAGPAFEGGQLSCGTGSIAGAIKDIKIQYGLVRYETIGRRPPVGICGTGLIAGMAELLKNKQMDSDGTLIQRYTSEGFQIVPGRIAISQQDIREFQKAKAAIRSGLDILVSSAGYNMEDIVSFELAGSFGSRMNVQYAVDTGLIPEELSDRVHVLGNAVITGLIGYLRMPDEQKICRMREQIREISLVNHPQFVQKYLDFMKFVQKK